MTDEFFSELPEEYKSLLELAANEQQLKVTPLQALTGGRSGAFLYLASVTKDDDKVVEHQVVKFDRVNPKAKSNEVEHPPSSLSDILRSLPTRSGKMRQLPFFIQLRVSPSSSSAPWPPRPSKLVWSSCSRQMPTSY